MPFGDKSAYTDKQKRKAEHIEEGDKDREVPEKEAERRAWATVNKESGSGRGGARWKRPMRVFVAKGAYQGSRSYARTFARLVAFDRSMYFVDAAPTKTAASQQLQ